MSIGLSVARAVYRCPIVRKPFDRAAELCGKVANHKTSRGTPLLPNYRYGLTRLILSDNSYWNNPLMKFAYREAPKSKTMLWVMRLLVTAEPIKDGFLHSFSTILPNSPEAAEILRGLDTQVSSDQTYICDGITSFKELFMGKFTQPPKITGGFHQIISPCLAAFMSRNYMQEHIPGFYATQMQTVARILKGIEILSHSMNGNEIASSTVG